MRFSILLAAWNEKEFARDCLESIKKQAFTDYEVLLVDDGSEDGTGAMIREEYPFVRLFELDRHQGFAKTNNLAARNAKGEWLFIVNTDTEFHPDLLAELDEATKRYPEFDIFSCQMVRFDDQRFVDCKGMRFHPSLRATMIGIGEPLDPEEQPFEVFGATGGAMLLRREVFERIGLFDETFYFNNEDVDFCLRAYGEGYRTLYLPSAIVYHRRSPNQKKMPDRVLYLIQRNMELAAVKNVPLILWGTPLGALHLAYNLHQFAKYAAQGKAKVILKSKWDALKMLPGLRRTPLSPSKLLKILGKKRVR